MYVDMKTLKYFFFVYIEVCFVQGKLTHLNLKLYPCNCVILGHILKSRYENGKNEYSDEMERFVVS